MVAESSGIRYDQPDIVLSRVREEHPAVWHYLLASSSDKPDSLCLFIRDADAGDGLRTSVTMMRLDDVYVIAALFEKMNKPRACGIAWRKQAVPSGHVRAFVSTGEDIHLRLVPMETK